MFKLNFLKKKENRKSGSNKGKVEDWSEFYNNNGRFYLTPHPSLEKFINLIQRKNLNNVLDMGCGSGRNVVRLAETGLKVSGIDFSPSAASLSENWLHQKGLDADIIVGNFDDKTKDFPDNSFGAIIAINSLEYADQAELENNLKEMKRMLRRIGMILIVYRSKNSKLKHPEVETLLLSEEDFRSLVSKYFRIIDFDIDKEQNFVLIAENL